MDNLLDIRTVAICNAAASYVLALTLASARSRLVEMKGIREFALAAALAGTSFVMAAMPGAIFRADVQTLIAVPGMTLAVGLMYAGACKFTGRPSPLRWVWLSVALMFFLTLVSFSFSWLMMLRLVVFSVIGALWSMLAGLHVLRYVDRALGFSRLMGAFALLLIAVVFVARAFSLLFLETDPKPLTDSATNRTAFFAGTVLMMLALAGATAMVNTRIGLEIARIAERDVLTGTLSRFGLKHAGTQWAAQHPNGYLLLVDLDHFKQVNDTLGHERGDDVLRMFSRVANDLLPKDSLIARYGGDEFLVLLPSKIDPEYFGVRLIEEFDQRIRVLLSADRALGVVPSLSVGVAMLRNSFSSAIRDADRALYRAKADGRGRIATWVDENPA
jgi:diguanylate cyclase (GGDEF)-like protein